MYLTYAEYKNMGGTLEETAFNDLEFEAETLINWYTFNRLKAEAEQPNEVKLCMNYLIKQLNASNNAVLGGESSETGTSGKAIASQSNDGVSISYNVLSQADVVSATKANIAPAITRYLNGVMNSLGQLVLYRGRYPNE